jgi:hypothetical protein
MTITLNLESLEKAARAEFDLEFSREVNSKIYIMENTTQEH